jgi:hypothetical protein
MPVMDFQEEPEPSLDNVVQTPSYAQIGWMKRNVQALGGTMLAGVCRPRGISYPHPELSGRTLMVNTQGCGNETLALIPQEGGDAAKVCLVCDGFIEWPRGDGEEATGQAEDPPPFLGDGPQAHWVRPRP